MRARIAASTILIVTLTVVALFRHAPAPASSASPAAVQTVAGVAITVSDVERAADFYSKVLFFEQVSDTVVTGDAWDRLQGLFGVRMRVVRMRLGEEMLELTEYLTPRGRPIPGDSRSNDRWFQHVAIIVNDIDQAWLWLRRHKVRLVSPAPQRLPDWNPSAGGIRAFYFTDPDGHPLELLQFPPDKGPAKWHRPSERVFLGIDHTAIVVGDTEASLAFYRDALGLKVVGGSENWGPEQERLNAVFGARLRITTLRAAEGVAVELLEYLTPRDGRPSPLDLRASDLAHWQTLVHVKELDQAFRRLRAGRFTLISPGPIGIDGTLGFREGLSVRDPDGHPLQLRLP